MPKNKINHSADSPHPQEWANLGVALPREMKIRLVQRAQERGLKASQYARTLLIDGMRREDVAA